MISQAKVDEIALLLQQRDLSQRKIARLVGVNRAAISQIARGVRPDYATRQRLMAELEEPLGPVARCDSCGGRVHMPCRLCRVRQFLSRMKKSPIANNRPLPVITLRKIG